MTILDLGLSETASARVVSFAASARQVHAHVMDAILAQQEKGGPLGPEFGKASPVGLFVILALLIVVFALGFSVNRHLKKMNLRKAVAEEEGIDPFDQEAIDRALARRGDKATTVPASAETRGAAEQSGSTAQSATQSDLSGHTDSESPDDAANR